MAMNHLSWLSPGRTAQRPKRRLRTNGREGPLTVGSGVNLELVKLFDNVVKSYVVDWYANVSEDNALLQQVRMGLQEIFNSFAKDVATLDLCDLVLHHALPAAVSHLDVYVSLRRRNPRSAHNVLEQHCLDAMHSDLHAALYSRDAEIRYIRGLSKALGAKYAPPHMLKSSLTESFLSEMLALVVLLPLMDIIADPDILNKLVILLFDPEPMKDYSAVPPDRKVELLSDFSKGICSPCSSVKNLRGDAHENSTSTPTSPDVNSVAATNRNSLLQVKLSDAIKDLKVLCAFTSYLESINGPLHYLQVVLSSHEVQEKINTVQGVESLSSEDLNLLRHQLWELLGNYFHESSPESSAFPQEYRDDFVRAYEVACKTSTPGAMKIVEGPLNRIYTYVYDILESEYMNGFCQSDFFFAMLAGSRKPPFHNETVSSCSTLTPSEENWITFNRLKTKLSNVFTESVEEGQMPLEMGDAIEEEDVFLEDVSVSRSDGMDESDSASVLSADEDYILPDFSAPERDLRQWTVRIPRVEPRRDPQTKHTMYVYVVDILRSDEPEDSPERHWSVDRRYNEFYVLETKLQEFHGAILGTSSLLPPKKSFGTKSRAFMSQHLPFFDEFLRTLLKIDALKGSELLYSFLTNSEEFTTGFLSDLNPFKVIRNVPSKFSKEKGQNLDGFLKTLVASTESFKQKGKGPGQADSQSEASVTSGISNESVVFEKMYETIFGNNCGYFAEHFLSPINRSSTPQNPDVAKFKEFKHPSKLVVYVLWKVFRIPSWFFSLICGAMCYLWHFVDESLEDALEASLTKALHEKRLAELIEAVNDLLFTSDQGYRTLDEKRCRTDEAWNSVLTFLRSIRNFGIPTRLLFGKDLIPNTRLVFDCFQSPRLNKQLTYVLLDRLLLNLYPDWKSI